MLLSAASAVSLNEDVLTLEFPRKGDVNGWLSSGYDQLLSDIIKSMDGIQLRVAAVASARASTDDRSNGREEALKQDELSDNAIGHSEEPPF